MGSGTTRDLSVRSQMRDNKSKDIINVHDYFYHDEKGNTAYKIVSKLVGLASSLWGQVPLEKCLKWSNRESETNCKAMKNYPVA